MTQPTPIRIQRKRTKGFNLQAVSRAANGLPCTSVARPGRWGNPYSVEIFGRDLALTLFRESMEGRWDPSLLGDFTDNALETTYNTYWAFIERLDGHPMELLSELRGHNLACFCSLSEPCHADILLEILGAQGK